MGKHRARIGLRIGLLADHNAEIKVGGEAGDSVVAHAYAPPRDGDAARVRFDTEAEPAGRF